MFLLLHSFLNIWNLLVSFETHHFHTCFISAHLKPLPKIKFCWNSKFWVTFTFFSRSSQKCRNDSKELERLTFRTYWPTISPCSPTRQNICEWKWFICYERIGDKTVQKYNNLPLISSSIRFSTSVKEQWCQSYKTKDKCSNIDTNLRADCSTGGQFGGTGEEFTGETDGRWFTLQNNNRSWCGGKQFTVSRKFLDKCSGRKNSLSFISGGWIIYE